MPFPKRLLTENEEVILDLRPHWIALVKPVLLTVVILAASVAAGIGFSKTSIAANWIAIGVGAVALVLWAVTVLPTILTWATTRFVLTDERLIARSGVIAKRSKEIPLEVVNDITFTQSLLARIVGAGTLVVESAGERGQEKFSNVSKPEERQKMIYQASESRKGLGSPSSRPGAISVADEIQKLSALRDSGTISADEFEARKKLLLGS